MSEKRMLYRSIQLDRAAVKKEDGRTVELTFSSEEPVERFWRGEIVWEVLDHSPESVDMARLAAGAPLLKDHDPGLHIGIIEQASIGTDRKGRAKVRFGKGALASEVFEDVADGIRPNVSVGYAITGGRVDGEKDGQPILRVTWRPMEISSASDATTARPRSSVRRSKPRPPRSAAKRLTRRPDRPRRPNRSPTPTPTPLKKEKERCPRST
jgi:hypothetical protein